MPDSPAPAVADAADSVQRNPVLRVLARAGYAASGLVHLLIGGIAIALAAGGGGEADQSGAMQGLAETPGGAIVLWLLVIALGALGLWELLEAATVRGGDRASRWRRRLAEIGKAAVYFALGGLALVFALGGRTQGEGSAEAASAGLLAVPGGVFLLAAIGAGVLAGGVGFAVIGATRRFRRRLRVPSGAPGRAVVALGVTGYVAKGVALGIVGVLLLVAAATSDPDAAGGLDGAFHALLGLPAGPVLVALVGAGLIAYGAFSIVRAPLARL